MNWMEERLSRLQRWEGYQHSVESREAMECKLDANENWHLPSAEIRKALTTSAEHLDPRSYPDVAVIDLAKEVSKEIGVSSESVIPCAGADQAIDLICQAFLGTGDSAVIVSPTFSMYRLRATIAGAECTCVPMLPDFRLPVAEILRRDGPGGVVFICSPNNPTGNQFNRDDVEQVLDSFRGLVVLDEAYVEFASYSLSRRVRNRRNLAVLRTFSKAYGMAALRLGYIVANDEWAPEFLAKVQYPYPVSGVAVAMAIAMMRNPGRIEEWIGKVRNERVWLTCRLRAIPGTLVVDSEANFLMASLPLDSGEAQKRLLAAGVSTRNLGDILGFPNCLRITVGTRRMNLQLLEGLRGIVAK